LKTRSWLRWYIFS